MVLLVEKLGIPKVTWPYDVKFRIFRIATTHRSVFHCCRSLNLTNMRTCQILELWRLHADKTHTNYHSSITPVCLARSSKREPVKACNEGKAAVQISFVVVCKNLHPEWKLELSCLLVAAAYPRSSKQGVLSCGDRQIASTLKPFVWKWSGYTKQPLCGERANTRVLKYDSLFRNSDASLSSNVIGQTPGRLAVPNFSTKNTRPPYEPTKWRTEVDWGRD